MAFFKYNISQENVCYEILEQKTTFQAINTKSLKSQKIKLFQKGLTHGYRQKIAIFPTFFVGNKNQEKVFYDILEQKNAFLGYKNKKFKKSKN